MIVAVDMPNFDILLSMTLAEWTITWVLTHQ